MLSKDICKKCCNNIAKVDGNWDKWNADDERRWRKGYVFCYIMLETQLINKECHSNCPYALEHLMSEKDNAKQDSV